MDPVIFRTTSDGSRLPSELGDPSGWLFYPCFGEDHLVVRPGESVRIGCGVTLSGGGTLTLHECPGSSSGLVIHPTVISNGDEVAVRLTNASRRVCVIAKDSFDAASRLGHGIYREAVIVPYELPIAQGLYMPGAMFRPPYNGAASGAEGMCAL